MLSGEVPRRAKRLALLGLTVNIGLASGKLAAGAIGGSFALVADAVESLADIAGSVIVWGGLHIGARPADEDHPYGHGKAEALAGLAVAIMVALAGVGIGIQAIRSIIAPGPTPEAWTLAVLVVVVVVKEALFRAARRAARAGGGVAIEADAGHHRSDAITSMAAFVGISVALVGGEAFKSADGWAALVAAGVIVFNGCRLLRRPVSELMDEGPADLIARARALAESVPGVIDVHRIAARRSGTSIWMDMHVRVDPSMTVLAAHALVHRVKDHIKAGAPGIHDVLIHVEPWDPRFAARPGTTGPGAH